MNLLVLTNYFPPEIGSASHLFYELSESLVKNGHKVTVVTGFPSYNVKEIPKRYRRRFFLREKLDGIKIIRLATVSLPREVPVTRGLEHFLVSLVLFLGGLISSKQDLVLVYSPPLPLGLSAYVLGRMKRIPFILNVQDIFPQNAIDLGILTNRFLINLFEAIERFIYKKADYITVHSEGNRKQVIAKGATSRKVIIIPNWVDTTLIRPSQEPNKFERDNNLAGKFIVSFAGIMGYSQDLETVIESAALVKSYEDILFLLVGDGVRKEKLQMKVKALKLSNVRFLSMQPRNIYPHILNASHVCLVTLKKEVKTPVIPSKLLGIMAAGRPVVASLDPNNEATKIIQTAKCGFCVDPENPKELSRAILKLCRNPALRDKLGKNGRCCVEKRFSRVICIRKYQSLFLKACGEF